MRNEYNSFLRKLYLFEERIEIVRNEIAVIESWRSRALIEGLLNSVWQDWCTFCRSIVIISCVGCKTRTGTIVPSRVAVNTWQRLGYEAKAAVLGHAINQTKVIQFRRNEPTWGDKDCLIKIVNTLRPSNHNDLVTAFGLPLHGPKHLQIVRNASMHTNSETVDDVRKLVLHYSNLHICNAYDILWGIDVKTRTIAVYQWLDDMRIIAREATR